MRKLSQSIIPTIWVGSESETMIFPSLKSSWNRTKAFSGGVEKFQRQRRYSIQQQLKPLECKLSGYVVEAAIAGGPF
jgi:hypothetical protein